MSNRQQHSTSYQGFLWKGIGLIVLLFFFAAPAFSQNTKGDSPVRNQRQIRETRLKSIKRKNNSTKDISGHRLRTKNKSSASRANASYPTPTPYAGRKKVKSDRPVKASPSYASPPRERQRPWTGDISGKPLRVVARNKKLKRGTLYPHIVYRGAAAGAVPVRHKPSEKQRAWRGGIDKGPIKNQSATGTIKNTFSQKGPYVRAYQKNVKPKGPSVSNRAVAGFSSRLSPGPPRRRAGAPRSASGNFRRGGSSPQSASGNFIKRGRRNVYWGKFSKGERAITTDLTGRAVRTRNYHSAPAGVVKDAFLRIGKRLPGGDRSYRGASGGFGTASKFGQKAWIGDISGHKLHNINPKRRPETASKFLFPRKLSVTTGGQAGRQLRGGGYSSRSRKRVGNQPLPPKAPGIGANGIDGGKGNNLRPGFDTQGAGFTGASKTKRQLKGGGSVSGKLWNNRQSPVGVRMPGQGSVRAGSFQGNIPKGNVNNYRDQGEDFAGFAKTRRPLKGGGSITRHWNNNQSPVGVRSPGQGSVRAGSFQGNIPRGSVNNYRDQGEDFAGFAKTRRPLKGGGSITTHWNNNQSPVGVRSPGQGSIRAGSFQGNIPRGSVNNYRDQGEDFAGFAKTRRPLKGGGSITTHWNNNQSPIGVRSPGQGSIRAGSFQGNIPRGSVNNYRDQGEDFAGFIKARKPLKGGGSITTHWNNNQSPIGVRSPGQGSVRAGSFQGNIPRESVNNYHDQGEEFAGFTKTKRPLKGGGSITMHWNNHGSPIEGNGPGAGTVKAGRYAGNIKTTRPPKGGGSISGKLWNNHEEPIEGRTPGKEAMAVGYSGKIKSNGYVQNPNAVKESSLKQRPDKSTYQVAGLQVKVREGSYKQKPYAAKGSLPGVAPSASSVKASEYAGNLKMYWSYKHNPSSADGAQRALYFGKAYARIGDYQGNIKMRKYNDKRLHPDAQFAHGVHDNVKGERTVMMDLKLMWSKVFKKSDTQPQNLKEKSERPRYDKGEKGLWADDPGFQKKKQAER